MNRKIEIDGITVTLGRGVHYDENTRTFYTVGGGGGMSSGGNASGTGGYPVTGVTFTEGHGGGGAVIRILNDPDVVFTVGNSIKATWAKDGKGVVLQIWLDGKPGDWITYDLEQMDGLIDLLRDCRVEMAKKLEVQ